MSNEMDMQVSETMEAVPATTLELMQRAEIDVQITTAKKYPRNIKSFLGKATTLATVDVDTAVSCIYRRPVGKENGRMRFAEGESIRLAEIVAASYGNLRYQGVISEVTPRYVKAIGMAHDLETNVAVKAEVAEPTVTRTGQPYSEAMRIVVAKAAQSKAIRDAIFRVVPKSLCHPIINACKQVIAGDIKTVEERRAGVLTWISKLAIEPERVYAALGIETEQDLTVDLIELLVGIHTAIRNNDTSIDEAFPPIVDESKPATTGVAAIKEKLAPTEPVKPDEPPVECRWYCQNCDHEFMRRKNGKLCPKCLSDKLIDRKEGSPEDDSAGDQ